MPALIPVTTAPVPVDATLELLLLHVPPAVGQVSVVVLPGQILVTPVIAFTAAVTLTTVVLKQPALSE